MANMMSVYATYLILAGLLIVVVLGQPAREVCLEPVD